MIALSALLLASALSVTAHSHSDIHARVHPHSDIHARAVITPITECRKGFSMTFDDGPSVYTTNVSTNLYNANAKGTFYMNGKNWNCIYDPDIVAHVQHVYSHGHEIASHTWSHPNVSTLTNAQIDVEIMRLDQAFIRILGIKPNIFRPPFGAILSAQVDYITSKHKKLVVTWDSDSGDSQGVNTNAGILAFYKHLADEAKNSGTGTCSKEAVAILQDASFNLITTSECLGVDAYTYIGAPQTRDSTWTCDGSWDVSDYSETPTTSTATTTGKTASTTTSPGSTSTSVPTTCSKTPYTILNGDYCWKMQPGATLKLCPSSSTGSTSSASTSSISATTSQATTAATTTSRTSTTASITTSTTLSTTASSAPTSSTCSKGTWTVKSGDYCYKIATDNGLTVEQLQSYNSGLNCDTLQPGVVLKLCSSGSTGSTASTFTSSISATTSRTTTATTTTSRTSTTASTATSITLSTTASATSTSSTCSKGTWTVKSGDYCYKIATDNGLTIEQLQSYNPNVNCNNLQVGVSMRLCLATSGGSGTTTASVPSSSTVPLSTCKRTVKLSSQATCQTIANQYKITLGDFNAWNPTITNCGTLGTGKVNSGTPSPIQTSKTLNPNAIVQLLNGDGGRGLRLELGGG
ncbi:hypothetical protein D9758_004122 [Tetrapyrgos nigripes]|uniref:Chitin deacetylase n=1 Tax=Tetrapyrgos nigripes TaxID=182062 RepID=A0A8H5GTY0_9AGAR|nr:hypothetical protein D9758_004122 [Tetrapyrgos nigripes]